MSEEESTCRTNMIEYIEYINYMIYIVSSPCVSRIFVYGLAVRYLTLQVESFMKM